MSVSLAVSPKCRATTYIIEKKKAGRVVRGRIFNLTPKRCHGFMAELISGEAPWRMILVFFVASTPQKPETLSSVQTFVLYC